MDRAPDGGWEPPHEADPADARDGAAALPGPPDGVPGTGAPADRPVYAEVDPADLADQLAELPDDDEDGR